MQTSKDSLYKKHSTFALKKTPYRIRSGDNLDIKFLSSDPNTAALLNKEVGVQHSSQVNQASLFIKSYAVNDSGKVILPVIGEVTARDLTVQQLTDTLTQRLEEILSIKNVSIKISNFRITLLGEVKNPGTQTIYSDHITLFQALGLAGDLTELGDRKKIKIIRNKEGAEEAEISYIDITRPECISSDYYFLKPDDVLYIPPVKMKATKTNLALYQAILASITALYLIFKITEIK